MDTAVCVTLVPRPPALPCGRCVPALIQLIQMNGLYQVSTELYDKLLIWIRCVAAVCRTGVHINRIDIHLLCLNSGSASFRGRIWRPITSLRRVRAVPISSKGSSKCRPSFPSFWRVHRYDPSWPHIFQGSLHTWKRRQKERKWRHRMV